MRLIDGTTHDRTCIPDDENDLPGCSVCGARCADGFVLNMFRIDRTGQVDHKDEYPKANQLQHRSVVKSRTFGQYIDPQTSSSNIFYNPLRSTST